MLRLHTLHLPDGPDGRINRFALIVEVPPTEEVLEHWEALVEKAREFGQQIGADATLVSQIPVEAL
jgi:hypothetical protein